MFFFTSAKIFSYLNHCYIFQGAAILTKDFRFGLFLSLQTLQEDLIFQKKQQPHLIHSEQLGDPEAGSSEGENVPGSSRMTLISDDPSPSLMK